MTATSADECRTKRRFVAVAELGGARGGSAEGVAEGVDGLALEPEPEPESDVGVDGGGDADVGVAEEFLDDDEFDALFQEEGGGRVACVRRGRVRVERVAIEQVECQRRFRDAGGRSCCIPATSMSQITRGTAVVGIMLWGPFRCVASS